MDSIRSCQQNIHYKWRFSLLATSVKWMRDFPSCLAMSAVRIFADEALWTFTSLGWVWAAILSMAQRAEGTKQWGSLSIPELCPLSQIGDGLFIGLPNYHSSDHVFLSLWGNPIFGSVHQALPLRDASRMARALEHQEWAFLQRQWPRVQIPKIQRSISS